MKRSVWPSFSLSSLTSSKTRRRRSQRCKIPRFSVKIGLGENIRSASGSRSSCVRERFNPQAGDLFITEADAEASRRGGGCGAGLNASSRCIGVSAIMDTAFFLFVPDTCNPRPLSKFRGNAFAPLSLPLHRAALCRREFWHDKGSRRCVSILVP